MKKKIDSETLKKMSYKDYLQTEYWQMLSEQVKANAKYKCQVCGRTAKEVTLHVHHNTYEHRGEEYKYMEDLVCLCGDCHQYFHDREKINKQMENLDNKLQIIVERFNKMDKQLQILKRENENLQSEKEYSDWKLRNYYNATVRNKKLEIQPIHLFDDKNDDLPF